MSGYSLLPQHIRNAPGIETFAMSQIGSAPLEALLNALTFGIVLVNRQGGILFANSAAQAMIRQRKPIASERGYLQSAQRPGKFGLQHAILKVAEDREDASKGGVGVPLPYPDGEPALAYVLPLTRGDVHAGGGHAAVMAIFVTPPARTQPPTAAIANLYGLTQAETRVLHAVASTRRAEVARRLRIAPSTLKTHMERIYAKTGIRDLPELVRVLSHLTPPVMPH